VLVSETAIQILISESKKTAPAAISSLKSRRQKSKEGGGLESDDSAESPLDCLFYGVIKCIATRQRSPFRTNGRHNKTERFISVYVVRCWEAIRPSEEKHTKKKSVPHRKPDHCAKCWYSRTHLPSEQRAWGIWSYNFQMIHLCSSAWYPLMTGKIRAHFETDTTLFTGNPSHIHSTVTQATHCVVQSSARPFPASYFLHIYTTVVFTLHVDAFSVSSIPYLS